MAIDPFEAQPWIDVPDPENPPPGAIEINAASLIESEERPAAWAKDYADDAIGSAMESVVKTADLAPAIADAVQDGADDAVDNAVAGLDIITGTDRRAPKLRSAAASTFTAPFLSRGRRIIGGPKSDGSWDWLGSFRVKGKDVIADGDARVPVQKAAQTWSWNVLSKSKHVMLGVKGRTLHTPPNIKLANSHTASVLRSSLWSFAVLGRGNRLGELRMDATGKVPAAVLAAWALRMGQSSQTITKTVKLDGTGDYSTLSAALAALVDGTSTRQYDLAIYPGVHSIVQGEVGPYVHARGVGRLGTVWIKGEQADSASTSSITANSTLQTRKTSSLTNLYVTAKNMRYAVHDEESGANPDAVHRYTDCVFEHLGNQGARDHRNANGNTPGPAADVWTGEIPIGFGSASGLVQTTERTTLKCGTQREALYVHNREDFSKPCQTTFRNVRAITENMTRAAGVQDMGSGQSDVFLLDRCEVTGLVVAQDDGVWITQQAAGQYADHADHRVIVTGCPVLGWRSNHRGRALKIESASTGSTSTVRVSGTAATVIFGTEPTGPVNRDGGGGLKGYAYGHWDISGIQVGLAGNVTVANTLGRRLGDCSSVSKTLTVVVDGGAPINVVFNTNLTVETNANIISTINAALGSAAVASEYDVTKGERYADFLDYQRTLVNGGALGIPKFAPVVYTGTTRRQVRLMETGDPASLCAGFAVDAIPPGKTGRILREAIFVVADGQLPGISTGTTVSTGDPVSLHASNNGQFTTGSSKTLGYAAYTGYIHLKAPGA